MCATEYPVLIKKWKKLHRAKQETTKKRYTHTRDYLPIYPTKHAFEHTLNHVCVCCMLYIFGVFPFFPHTFAYEILLSPSPLPPLFSFVLPPHMNSSGQIYFNVAVHMENHAFNQKSIYQNEYFKLSPRSGVASTQFDHICVFSAALLLGTQFVLFLLVFGNNLLVHIAHISRIKWYLGAYKSYSAHWPVSSHQKRFPPKNQICNKSIRFHHEIHDECIIKQQTAIIDISMNRAKLASAIKDCKRKKKNRTQKRGVE